MSSITFEQATCLYPGSEIPAVDHIDLRIGDGELLVLVGPPGAGKTTALRVIAGLEDLSSGRVFIGERDVTRVPPKDRDVAMVFQNYALYPHLSVADNMGFSLKIAGLDAAEVRSRVEEAAAILELSPFLDEKPAGLSSAQRQQVALGRAVVRRPQVFLMDEPLVSLDPGLREQTREQIVRLQKQLGVTTVYATADQVEAMMMGDRVAVLDSGRLLQVDTPPTIYDEPVDQTVARLIGLPPMNILRRPVTGGVVRLGPWQRQVGVTDGQVDVGVRPEDLVVSEQTAPGALSGRVLELLDTPAGAYVRVSESETQEALLARVSGATPEVGSQVGLAPDPAHVHLFSAADGRRLATGTA